MDEHLRRMAEAFPDQVAFSVVDVGDLTFAEWEGSANALARGLVDGGLPPGGRVALHLHTDHALRWLVSYAAVHRAGGVAVPMNPRLAPAEVSHMLAHSGASAVVADGELIAQDLGVANDGLTLVVDATTGAPPPAPPARSGPRLAAWDEVTSGDRAAMQVPRDADDLADILYTSGTTGRPKGVAVRHSNGSMVGEVEPSWTGGGWLHASPMFTFAGIALVYTPAKLGLRGVYQPRFDATRWLQVVEAEHPVAVFLVPAMAHLLLDHPRFETADFSSVSLCSVGSAPLAPFVVERLQERMPDAMVSNNYGMTEAGSAYCIMPQGEAVKRPGSVGMIAPPALVRIVDTNEEPQPPNEVGEVRLKLPGHQREYFGDPEATAETWKDGWVITGDLGRLDDDGYLYIVGRSKDVIIRGGNNVHATDVEHVLVQHDAVAEVAVVGAPHAVLGEDVVAFVVLHEGADADGESLRAYALEQLADYKVPRQFHFVDGLPRNATGKVIKPELRARLVDAAP
ncbi:MAG TPA: AMP-binding protein [Acidimicrobiales bacterium]|jgi:acyl-CoA synthetase (AMP-forming)/AMP-acid ligase II